LLFLFLRDDFTRQDKTRQDKTRQDKTQPLVFSKTFKDIQSNSSVYRKQVYYVFNGVNYEKDFNCNVFIGINFDGFLWWR